MYKTFSTCLFYYQISGPGILEFCIKRGKTNQPTNQNQGRTSCRNIKLLCHTDLSGPLAVCGNDQCWKPWRCDNHGTTWLCCSCISKTWHFHWNINFISPINQWKQIRMLFVPVLWERRGRGIKQSCVVIHVVITVFSFSRKQQCLCTWGFTVVFMDQLYV